MVSSEPILRVEGLSKSYSGGLFKARQEVIRDLDLEVERGSVFGLLGPNGAGKTTLIKVLLSLVRHQRGRAWLFGRPVRDPRARRQVGYLPEAHRLPGYLSGRQVLRLFAMLCGRPRSWVEPRLDGWLERVDMLGDGDRKLRTYSKGMQQRIGLAQALVHEPELVFLDEPTDGVDPVGRRAIREIIADLRGRGITIFINSHLLLEVERMCDRVVILHRGEIIREGSIEELTPADEAIRFEVDALPPDLEGILAGVGSDLRISGERHFDLAADGAELDAAVDRLRAARVGIRGLQRARVTLEDAFIDLVSDRGKA